MASKVTQEPKAVLVKLAGQELTAVMRIQAQTAILEIQADPVKMVELVRPAKSATLALTVTLAAARPLTSGKPSCVRLRRSLTLPRVTEWVTARRNSL